MPCSFSLSPQVWCSRPQTVLKLSAEICLGSLMCFLYLWVGVVVFWMWSDEYWARQSSLLSAGCSPAHTAEETAGLCCQCTLLAHVQLHTHQDFPLAFLPVRPSLYCVFLPKCRTRLLFLLNFRRFLLFCLKTGARFAFFLFLWACTAPFKGAPCRWASLDAACQVPWMPMGWVLLRYLSQSSPTAGHPLLQLCLSVLRPGGPFWWRLGQRRCGEPQPYLCAWSLSHLPLLLCSLKNR